MLRAALLIAGLALLVYLVVELGPGEIFDLLKQIGWGFVPIAALYGTYQALRAQALCLSAPRAGAVAFRDALAVRLSGEAVQFLTSTGPFLAEPSKALLLGRRGLTKTEGFATTIAEYLAYTFVSAAMLAGAMSYLIARAELGRALTNAAVLLLVISVTFLVVSAVAIWRRIYLIGRVARALDRIPAVGRRLKLVSADVRHMEDLLLGLLRERPAGFARLLALELLANAVLVVELWWILWMIGVAPSLVHALVLESGGKFVTLAFFFIPGQIGASEGVHAVLFQALGFAAVTGVAVALARRIRSALTAGAGLVALMLVTKRSR